MKRKVLIASLATLLVAIVLLASYLRLLDRFELITLDFRYNFRPAQTTNPDIVLIEIAEDSLKALGRFPFPRDYHATLIDILRAVGVRMIVFDIMFSEPSDRDKEFIEALRKTKNVYIPFAFRLSEEKSGGVPEAISLDAPLFKGLETALTSSGFINRWTDQDGKVRRVLPFMRYKGDFYPHLTLKAACDYLDIPLKQISVTKSQKVTIDDRLILPIDEDGTMLLNFAGRWTDTFSHYSYVDIIAAYHDMTSGKEPRIDLDGLRGKVCFIGLTAAGTHDLSPVPLEAVYPMVGVNVNLFNMITEGIHLRRMGRTGNMLMLIALSLLLFFLIKRPRPFIGLLITVIFIVSLIAASMILFGFFGLWIDLAYPTVLLGILFLAVTLTKFFREARKRQQIEKELAVAKSIQESFLPSDIPQLDRFEIAVNMDTAKHVGGDLYDIIIIAGGKLGVMIGDVSGKGVPAALYMAKAETLFRAFSKSETSPSAVVTKMNDELSADSRSGLFVSLIYSVFDVSADKCAFSNAGHLPIMRLRSGKAQLIPSDGGMVAGVMEGADFVDENVALIKGDVLAMYTDGVTEAMNIKREEFGENRLAALLEKAGGQSADDILKVIMEGIRQFQGKAPQHDDITLIVVKIK
ncbi:MAG: SpoIIE family protein phosphatase [Candidatus Omnitrophica bacterium]|nr:SpoIIE family protein phosphatase [Candidatus Omnitrophota bacterium]